MKSLYACMSLVSFAETYPYFNDKELHSTEEFISQPL